MSPDLITLPAPTLPNSTTLRIIINEVFSLGRTGELYQRTECHPLLTPTETYLEASQNPAYDEMTRQAYAQMGQPIICVTSTENSFVDQYGNLLESDENRQYPEGAIRQRDWFRSLTLAQLRQMGMPINDDTTLWSIIQQFLLMEMERSVSRNKYGGVLPPANP